MPYLIVLGIIVAGIAVAIFKVNKVKSDQFIEMMKQAKMADDIDGEVVDVDITDDADEGSGETSDQEDDNRSK